MFFGPDRIYFESGKDMGYMVDTGNNDVRTEGMSYGMMMAVQMNNKEIFDRIWRWSLKYMQHKSGIYKDYFAWSCKLDGTRNAQGPAPDGEEYFAMALFFASHRWGDGKPPSTTAARPAKSSGLAYTRAVQASRGSHVGPGNIPNQVCPRDALYRSLLSSPAFLRTFCQVGR